MKTFDDEPKPIMKYVHDLETKVRELQDRNKDLARGMLYLVTIKSPFALGLGYGLGAISGVIAILVFKSKGG